MIGQAEAKVLEVERRAVARAQAGDVSLLTPILVAHADALFAQVILPRVGERAAAEDLLRDTFVTAIEKIGGYRERGVGIYFWLRRIALHKVIDLHRARGRSRRLLETLRSEAEGAPPAGAADESLLAAEDGRRARERIEQALSALPERYARALRLRLIEERPRDECARELGVSMPTFDVTLFRAVRAFRKAYGER